jgi:hypothetical protein
LLPAGQAAGRGVGREEVLHGPGLAVVGEALGAEDGVLGDGQDPGLLFGGALGLGDGEDLEGRDGGTPLTRRILAPANIARKESANGATSPASPWPTEESFLRLTTWFRSPMADETLHRTSSPFVPITTAKRTTACERRKCETRFSGMFVGRTSDDTSLSTILADGT